MMFQFWISSPDSNSNEDVWRLSSLVVLAKSHASRCMAVMLLNWISSPEFLNREDNLTSEPITI